jgi:NADP-reducing hydrogenase subunit HndB
MGYCYAEPTIELTIPGKEPVVYGFVNRTKALEIIEKHIKLNELLDGIIPVTYSSISN